MRVTGEYRGRSSRCPVRDVSPPWSSSAAPPAARERRHGGTPLYAGHRSPSPQPAPSARASSRGRSVTALALLLTVVAAAGLTTSQVRHLARYADEGDVGGVVQAGVVLFLALLLV